MSLDLKLYKSAGVPVTSAVHRRLIEANRARDARDWTAAAAGYREALARDPELAHIWIQLGHALKESEHFTDAGVAYHRAAALNPMDAEPHLHLGHLKKRLGDGIGASRSYLRAVRLDPAHPDAMVELHSLAAWSTDLRPEDLMEILRPVMGDAAIAIGNDTVQDAARRATAGLQDLLDAVRRANGDSDASTLDQLAAAGELVAEIGRRAAAEATVSRPDGAALVFDVSDLISYFRDARLPTGIQRVQIEIISAALQAQGGRTMKICCFLEHRDEWLEVPSSAFIALCRLSMSHGDRTAPEWTTALNRLYVLLNMAEAMVFPSGAYLINLGTSWWLQNYFLLVRQAKARYGVRYVPFVHDLIPIMAPESCAKGLVQDFISWMIGVFDHADVFLVNSQATKRDLLMVAALLGHTLDEDHIVVARLDADFRKPAMARVDKNALGRWGLRRKPFVLFVATIEARKNHLCAFEAWLDLVRRQGPKATPKLVCVGKSGWLNDAVYAQLEANDLLRDHVVMLSGLSDPELALLYEACLFTIYPSRYEGWGLPVTESLCYGKTPIVADVSSLPEAGGPFAVYFEAGSPARLADAAERMIVDPAYREACAHKIAREFRPRTWQAIADQICAQLADLDDGSGPDLQRLPRAELGAYHPVARNVATHIWPGLRSAEVFRAGDGWWGPDDWGCWTKAQGARLMMELPKGHGPLRLFLHLHGLPTKACDFIVDAGGAIVEGELKPGESKWVPLDVPPAGVGPCVFEVRLDSSKTEDLAKVTGGGDVRLVSVGLAGFFLCAAEDVVSRAAFLEAVALGSLADLAFNRKRELAAAASPAPPPLIGLPQRPVAVPA